MTELEKAIEAMLAGVPGRIVLSAPRTPGQAGSGKPAQAYTRAVATPLPAGWQVERFTKTQAFHQNVATAQLATVLQDMLENQFTQLTAFAQDRQFSLRLSKKGKVLAHWHSTNAHAAHGQGAPKGTPAGGAAFQQNVPLHDRQKKRILPQGVAVAPLVDIGVMGTDGQPIAAKRDKLRQIERFVELVDDAFRTKKATEMLKSEKPLRVVDFGCGKSYLTFVLYYYFTEVRKIPVEMTGLDLRQDVVETCNAAARKYGYSKLGFAVGDVAGWQAEGGVDVVVTLHACDTATDHALAKAVQWQAGMVFSVPCCQHELNAQMQSEPLAALTRYGIVKERTAALMTDAIRANLLAACGYKTQLVEFVDAEHTPKNIMIRAVKTALPLTQRKAMLEEVHCLCGAFSLRPTLLQLLQSTGALPE